MKKRLNLLCAIVLLVLGWSVVVTGYYMTRGAVEGFRQGWNYAEAEEKAKETGEPMPEELRVMQHTKYISLLPPMLSGWKGDMLPDSVYNERTHSYIPAAYASLTVSVEAGSPWTRGLLGLLVFIANIWALVVFIRLVRCSSAWSSPSTARISSVGATSAACAGWAYSWSWPSPAPGCRSGLNCKRCATSCPSRTTS